MQQYEMPNNDAPGLVLFKNSISDVEGWERLSGHACNGFRLDYLSGYVKTLSPSTQGLKIISRITDEEFCKSCDPQNLDWDIKQEHRDAYGSFLSTFGLVEGGMDLFQQAVYPLEATSANLNHLGISDVDIPEGAVILVLGWNCD
ncbi:MAG: hypothetical protein Q7K26_01335 [bacterium]|nr:hypothetical protein [bacterium]